MNLEVNYFQYKQNISLINKKYLISISFVDYLLNWLLFLFVLFGVCNFYQIVHVDSLIEIRYIYYNLHFSFSFGMRINNKIYKHHLPTIYYFLPLFNLQVLQIIRYNPQSFRSIIWVLDFQSESCLLCSTGYNNMCVLKNRFRNFQLKQPLTMNFSRYFITREDDVLVTVI